MRRLLIVESVAPVRPSMIESQMGGLLKVHEATAADVTAAFVAQCREDGVGDRLRAELESIFVNGTTIGRMAMASELRQTLGILGLSALLEPEAGSEGQTARESEGGTK